MFYNYNLAVLDKYNKINVERKHPEANDNERMKIFRENIDIGKGVSVYFT